MTVQMRKRQIEDVVLVISQGQMINRERKRKRMKERESLCE
jgi:hypothetical protein